MNPNLNYRPEIDGLRAIAVLLVILHHLGLSALKGGYIGVDVFFVISGYLITKIVTGEIQSGSFTLKNFYKRRIIRLAPAYFLVLFVTTLVSMVVMLPAELLAYFKSVIFSTLFSANFFMWREVGGYFGVMADKVPLLHLWSLAVEEQFYIFWPLALLGLYKVVKPKYFLVIVAVAVLICLWVSEWGVNNYRAAAYYLMPTRAFELLVGALIAFIPKVLLKPREASGATLLGLVMIMVPAVTYSTESFFPGMNALMPCVGTALILAFGSHQNDLVSRILATAPLNFVGRISYPAYLWHWPLIVFLKIYLIEIDGYIATGVMAATLLLSTLTYWYLEKPAKSAQEFKFFKVVGVGFALPAVAFLSFSVFAESSNGWPGRFSESLNLKSNAINSQAQKIRSSCHDRNASNPHSSDECILGVNKPGVDFLLIGDSHANHFAGMIDVMAKDAGMRGWDITQSNTIYLPDVNSYFIQDGTKVLNKNFRVRNNKLTELIENNKYKYVVMAASFVNHMNNEHYELSNTSSNPIDIFKNQLNVAVVNIINSGATPVIISDSPFFPVGIEYCSINNERFTLNDSCNIKVGDYFDNSRIWSKYLSILAREHKELIIINPEKIICDSNYCYSEIDGIPLYRDNNHLNYVGSKLIGELYLKQIGNPFMGNVRQRQPPSHESSLSNHVLHQRNVRHTQTGINKARVPMVYVHTQRKTTYMAPDQLIIAPPLGLTPVERTSVHHGGPKPALQNSSQYKHLAAHTPSAVLACV